MIDQDFDAGEAGMSLRGLRFYRGSALALVAGLLVVMIALALTASRANADVEVGSTGTGAGQTMDPRGIDVDEGEDLLYVADRGNNRIDVFDASTGIFVRAFGWGVLNGANELQVCTTTCQAGIAGSGSGQLNGVQGIAVDNDSASPGFHAVYIYDVANRRIQRFTSTGEFVWMAGDGVNVTSGGDLCTKASGDVCGPGTGGAGADQLNDPEGDTIDVGPGGTVYVGDRTETGTPKTRVQLWSSAGVYLGLLGGKLLEVSGGSGNLTALAVDSTSNVYVGTTNEFGSGAVRKYDNSGNEVVAFNPSFNINTVATGPEDHVFVGDNSQFEEEVNSTIFEYSSAGVLLRAIYGSLESRTYGLTIYASPLGDLFAVELRAEGKKRIIAIDFPPPGPTVYPRPSALFVSPIGNVKATLHGKVNPEGEATTYYFEYITDEAFKAAGNSFGAGTIKTPDQGPLPADFKLHPVEVEIKGLQTETIYHFRIVVVSAATGTTGNPGPESTFKTKKALEFGDLWSTDVSASSATLHAEVDPLGIPATARFEYVELSKYEETGFAEAVQVPASSEDPIDLGEGEGFKEVAVQLTGLEAGTSYRYRIVATNRCKPEPAPLCDFAEPEATFSTFLPLDPAIGCPNDSLRASGSGTFLPDCRGYEMVSPVDKNGAFVEPVFNINGFPAGLDQAAVDGNSATFSAYKAFGDVDSAPYINQYLSRRTSEGWQTEGISPEREGPSIMTYLSAELDRQYKAFSQDLCSGWVVQDANPILAAGAPEGFPGLYRRDNCGASTGSYESLINEAPPNLAPRKLIPELQGTSADGSVSVFAVNDNLVPGAPAQPAACVNETNPSGEPCDTRLYEARDEQLSLVCILPDETPYPGSCGVGTPSGNTIGRAANVSNAVSEDGSRIFWSASDGGPGPLYVRLDNSQPSAETIQISASSAQFWTAAADGSKAIYSVGGKLLEYDVDSETASPIAEGLIGFAGASEDASRIYFASTKVLTGEVENSQGDKAKAGEPNFYLFEAGTGFRFIGILAESDLNSGTQPSSPLAENPAAHLSRVSADGQAVAFMSSAQLTGYDNKDAATAGKVAMEVFLYEAESEQILCPSCNPTGARPEGRQLTQKLLETRWAAARIPTFQSQLYGARVLSDDGDRLYFDSFDALSIRDTNEEEDVYQWQAAGSGSCTTASATYHEVSGGCIDLISSGQSPQGSELVDISSDGDDVFFKTNESLVTQDPGLRDIYDARANGGFPPLPPKPEICEGEFCPKPPVTPPPATNPGSQTPGPGNPPSSKPKPKKCPKGKHKVKKNGKVRCVKNKKHKAKKRAGNNRRAAR